MIVLLLNIMFPILAVIGMYLLSKKNKNGFIVFLLMDAGMIYISLLYAQYGMTLTALLYVVMQSYAYYKWSEDDK
jgi:nicotinamide riboside transporter PnuC